MGTGLESIIERKEKKKMSNLDIHVCKCGAMPRLVYSAPYTVGSRPKIQVRCFECGVRNYPRGDSVEAIKNWNERFA